MDNVTYSPRLLPALIQAGAFRQEPFTLFDVGCSGGIDDLWRKFGDQFRAYAFDPQQAEVARLQAQEKDPHVEYIPAFVGLQADHPFKVRKAAQRTDDDYQSEVMSRSSTWVRNLVPTAAKAPPPPPAPPPPRIGVADFIRQRQIHDVDFIKIDTDGSDLECVISSEDCFRPCNVLGLLVETSFQGSSDDTSNVFHNIDRLLKRHGYMIYNIALARYSRDALPARYQYSNCPAQTISGQPVWGDTLYFLDGTTKGRFAALAAGLSPVKVLKLACLYEMFLVPDCAIELLQHHAARLAKLVKVDQLIELLTPSLNNRQVSYREYVEALRKSAA